MTKEEALLLWLDEIGDNLYAYDFSGKKIKKTDYLMNNEVGWVISYIKPPKLGGAKTKGNIIIMHHRTEEEKGNNYPEFMIGHKKYTAFYEAKDDFYYIEENLLEEDED